VQEIHIQYTYMRNIQVHKHKKVKSELGFYVAVQLLQPNVARWIELQPRPNGQDLVGRKCRESKLAKGK